ncbi:hypothetical protein AGMMS50262_04920 [Bacteroidia bacterium]|nr:hypothetical protein AGMMS50262_04920 [Bacteroidia bacterium]
MVYSSKTFEDDLVRLIFALSQWEKHSLEWEEVQSYVNDIIQEAYTLDTKSMHKPCLYAIHNNFIIL